jgi:pimeloyl-ACP methyl ester carboxylesterase
LTTFVLVHGAWHSGNHLEPVAEHIRSFGHEVFLPTLRGNGKNDDKSTGLEEAITSLLKFIDKQGLSDFVLVGHSYAGMVITAVADRIPHLIRRLIYWNAFVPVNGESLNDLVPPEFLTLWKEARKT